MDIIYDLQPFTTNVHPERVIKILKYAKKYSLRPFRVASNFNYCISFVCFCTCTIVSSYREEITL